jgi:hypothetical protein
MPSTLSAKDVPSPHPKVKVIVETWDPRIGLAVIGGECMKHKG